MLRTNVLQTEPSPERHIEALFEKTDLTMQENGKIMQKLELY